jgi:prepilin-type N-terminal cleavage/methylation domain-containing protein
MLAMLVVLGHGFVHPLPNCVCGMGEDGHGTAASPAHSSPSSSHPGLPHPFDVCPEKECPLCAALHSGLLLPDVPLGDTLSWGVLSEPIALYDLLLPSTSAQGVKISRAPPSDSDRAKAAWAVCLSESISRDTRLSRAQEAFHMISHFRRDAFTLIELLIVVAIIAILAAIAVPNFLEAQMRAKTSRVVGEFRTCSTAIETYRLDQGLYPAYNGLDNYIQPAVALDAGPHFLPYSLTTPVAYLASLFNEIFEGRNTPESIPTTHEYHYFTRYQSPTFFATREFLHFGTDQSGRAYFMASNGPDLWCDGAGMKIYDPPNGTKSEGDIIHFAP